MKKIYTLLVCLLLSQFFVSINAQTGSQDVASFTTSIDTINNNVTFYNNSTFGNEPGTRHALWNFGDGTSASTGGQDNIQHHYQVAGTYNVCLSIYRIRPNLNDSVLMDQICKTVIIPVACRANFEYHDSIVSINPVQHLVRFWAIPKHNGNKPVIQVCWNFGDGSDTCINYTNSTPGTNSPLMIQHTYLQQGPYNVCVKIKYLEGCVADKCRTITLNNVPPPAADSCVANFEQIPNSTTADGRYATFKALPWHSLNKKPVKICWNFGDGQDTCIQYTNSYTGQYTVGHHYTNAGQYNVCVKITYDGGCEKTKCKTITIPPPQNSCSANLFVITPSINSLVRGFYGTISSIPYHLAQSVCWKFGDGKDTCIVSDSANPGQALSIQHLYPGPGVYRACLRVVFQGGCVAESCKEIVIGSASNLCGGYMTDSLVGANTFKFKGYSIHNPTDPVISYHWTFGDGTTGTGQEITHSYQSGIEHRVCLTIVTQSACETRICKTVRSLDNNSQSSLVATPNPVINVLHVSFLSIIAETVTVKITNSNGVVVRTYTRAVTAGNNSWDITVGDLPPGIYLLSVQSPNQQASTMFLKQ